MCPVCGEPLVTYELDSIEIDHCVTCLGTWLDAGELEMIAERAGVASGAMTIALNKRREGRPTKRRCPRCRRRLREIDICGTQTVSIDTCPRRHGLWFDRGEMQAVIRSFAEGEAGEVARFFADLYRSENEAP